MRLASLETSVAADGQVVRAGARMPRCDLGAARHPGAWSAAEELQGGLERVVQAVAQGDADEGPRGGDACCVVDVVLGAGTGHGRCSVLPGDGFLLGDGSVREAVA